MDFLLWTIVGLIAGWSAGKILEGNGYGPLMDIRIGIGGALAGGFLMRSVGFSGYQGTIYTTFVAIICATLLTLLIGFVNGRRLCARQAEHQKKETDDLEITRQKNQKSFRL